MKTSSSISRHFMLKNEYRHVRMVRVTAYHGLRLRITRLVTGPAGAASTRTCTGTAVRCGSVTASAAV